MREHTEHMLRALELARKAEGYTRPNPMVGAVIVRDSIVVGEGYHRQAGLPHAEIEALHQAGEAAQGATLYVTLEPCNHFGRTPPCTAAIIKAGINRVVYAVPDPNPRVAGGGHHCLLEAGIEVINGICAEEAYHLNRFFFHYVQKEFPYVVAKFAMSLDGKIATHRQQSQWITSDAARERGHTLRHAVGAILVGKGTVIADNPRLTARLPVDLPQHPLRVVLDSRGTIPLSSNLFSANVPGHTLVATTDAMSVTYEKKLINRGVEVLRVSATPTGRVDIGIVLHELGQRHIQSVLVEGGSTVHGAFFDGGYVNEVWAFIAPIIIGGHDAPSPIGGTGCAYIHEAVRLSHRVVEQIGDEIVIRGVLCSQES